MIIEHRLRSVKNFGDFKYCENGKIAPAINGVLTQNNTTETNKNLKKVQIIIARQGERERGSKSEIIIVLIPTTKYTMLSHPSHFCIYMQFRADNATRYCSHDFPIAHGRGSECAEKGGGMCIVG